MRVLELTGHDGPSALRVADRPRPTAPKDGVIIDVEAIGINFPDLLATKGMYQYKPELPYIPGCEVAGRIREAAPGSIFTPGERVAAFVWEGGYAESVWAPDRSVMPLPASVTSEIGAALVVNYHTVHFGLSVRGQLKAGESLLVLGSGGGIGTAALQVGQALGARVVAAVTDDNQEVTARGAGAQETLRVEGGFAQGMLDLTEGRGFDVVLDPLGDRYFTEAIRGLAPGGRILVVGFAAGEIPTVAVNRLLFRNIAVVGVAWGAFLEVDPDIVAVAGRDLTHMLERSAIAPHIAEVSTFELIPEALARLERGEIRGKAVATLALKSPGRPGRPGQAASVT